jgi:hypothetical protein
VPSDEARSVTAPALGIAVALFELHAQEWLDFIGSFASVVVTFLAGLEVDPATSASAP